MKSKLNLPLIIGIALLLTGFVLAKCIGPALYDSLPSVEAPSIQTDNPIFALPLYLARLLFQATGPLLMIFLGVALAVARHRDQFSAELKLLESKGRPAVPPRTK